jgi:diguanylate cyclase (GGDEF)-like protein/PAS domain S-box-containing protein
MTAESARPTGSGDAHPDAQRGLAEAILRQQVLLLHRVAGRDLWVGGLAALIVAAWIGPVLPIASLAGWIGLHAAVTLVRAWDGAAFQRDSDSRPPGAWQRRLALGAAASGAVWGGVWALIPAAAPATLWLFVAVVVAGLVTASAHGSAVLFPVLRNHAVAAMLPAACFLALRGNAAELAVALLLILQLAAALLHARRLHRATAAELEARFRDEHRLVFLLGANRRLRRLATDLEQGLQTRTRELEAELAERRRVEATLRGKEAMFKLITDNASDMIAVWDRHGEQLYGSRSLTRALGRSRPGDTQPGFAHVHAVDMMRLRDTLRRTLESASGQRLELRVRHDHGQTRIIDCSIEPVRDAGADPDKVVIVARDVTQRRMEEKQVRDARERLALAIEATGQSLFDVDCRRRLVYLDRGWGAILGREPGDTTTSLEELLHLVPQEERDQLRLRYLAALKGEIPEYLAEHRIQAADGRHRWILSRAKVVERDGDGFAVRLIGTNVDVTRQREAQRALRLAGGALDGMTEGLVILDSSLRVESVNPAFTRITGWTAEEVVGRASDIWRRRVSGDETAVAIVTAVQQARHWQGRVVEHRKDGSPYPARLSISAMADEAGGEGHFVMLFSDATREEADEAQVRFLAHHDTLTGLANRALFFSRAEELIRRARRHGRRLAILFIDLDHFKHINDRAGHHAGDHVLTQVAERLQAGLRDLDLVARLGGDEFAVLLDEIAEPADVATVADKLLQSISAPLVIGDQPWRLGASMGISRFPEDGGTAEVLVQHADTAMYCAKESGRNRYHFFSPHLTAQVARRLSTASGLRHAVGRGELDVFYQPSVDPRSGQILGTEALVRWNHPVRGTLLPSQFIDVAEESGIIDEIGRWVLTRACEQLAAWQRDGHAHLTVKVNLSPLQFRQPDLLHQVRSSMETAGITPGTLEVEITESVAMGDPERSERVLAGMRDLGIRIALDDFGTGHSSLAQLSRFPIQCLKIDRSLVAGLPHDHKTVVITSTVANLCRSLGLELVGEGVESDAQASFLAEQGCQQMQGFLFSPALDARAMTAIIGRGQHPEWALGGHSARLH